MTRAALGSPPLSTGIRWRRDHRTALDVRGSGPRVDRPAGARNALRHHTLWERHGPPFRGVSPLDCQVRADTRCRLKSGNGTQCPGGSPDDLWIAYDRAARRELASETTGGCKNGAASGASRRCHHGGPVVREPARFSRRRCTRARCESNSHGLRYGHPARFRHTGRWSMATITDPTRWGVDL